jgi:ribosome-binding factor A
VGNPKDLVDILQGEVKKTDNLIISVSKVVVTSDLSVATVHLNIPSGKNKGLLEAKVEF